jgi:hypothetical protein
MYRPPARSKQVQNQAGLFGISDAQFTVGASLFILDSPSTTRSSCLSCNSVACIQKIQISNLCRGTGHSNRIFISDLSVGCQIWGYHGGDYDDMCSGILRGVVITSRKCLLPPSSGQKSVRGGWMKIYIAKFHNFLPDYTAPEQNKTYCRIVIVI